MDTEPKISKSITLDPVVNAWVSKKVGLLKMAGEKANDSSFINDSLKRLMQQDEAEEDVRHLQKMFKRQILKQK